MAATRRSFYPQLGGDVERRSLIGPRDRVWRSNRVYTSKIGVQEMQSQTTDENSLSFIGWQYPDGSLRIAVESVADHVDDDPTLFTYSPLVGIKAGMPKVVSLDERASILVFRGPYDDQLWIRPGRLILDKASVLGVAADPGVLASGLDPA
jgi:hypothetical protein